MHLVALRIQIELQGSTWTYPDFDKITPAYRGNVRWQEFIDRYGGWYYDQCCDFMETDAENPDEGIKIGCFLVPKDFAIEAVEMFGDSVSILDEATFEKFHDDRAQIHQPVEKIDSDVVNGLRAKYGQIGMLDPSVMTQEEQEMLNPEHPRLGIVKNKKRKFADVKASKNLILGTLD